MEIAELIPAIRNRILKRRTEADGMIADSPVRKSADTMLCKKAAINQIR